MKLPIACVCAGKKRKFRIFVVCAINTRGDKYVVYNTSELNNAETSTLKTLSMPKIHRNLRPDLERKCRLKA